MFSLVFAGGKGAGIETGGERGGLEGGELGSGLAIMIGFFFGNYRLIGNENESYPQIFLVKIYANPENILLGILFREFAPVIF